MTLGFAFRLARVVFPSSCCSLSQQKVDDLSRFHRFLFSRRNPHNLHRKLDFIRNPKPTNCSDCQAAGCSVFKMRENRSLIKFWRRSLPKSNLFTRTGDASITHCHPEHDVVLEYGLCATQAQDRKVRNVVFCTAWINRSSKSRKAARNVLKNRLAQSLKNCGRRYMMICSHSHSVAIRSWKASAATACSSFGNQRPTSLSVALMCLRPRCQERGTRSLTASIGDSGIDKSSDRGLKEMGGCEAVL